MTQLPVVKAEHVPTLQLDLNTLHTYVYDPIRPASACRVGLASTCMRPLFDCDNKPPSFFFSLGGDFPELVLGRLYQNNSPIYTSVFSEVRAP